MKNVTCNNCNRVPSDSLAIIGAGTGFFICANCIVEFSKSLLTSDDKLAGITKPNSSCQLCSGKNQSLHFVSMSQGSLICHHCIALCHHILLENVSSWDGAQRAITDRFLKVTGFEVLSNIPEPSRVQKMKTQIKNWWMIFKKKS